MDLLRAGFEVKEKDLKQEMSDVRKSALWALISIPISFLLLGVLVHGGPGVLQAPYIPGVIVLELLGMEGESWIFPAQYFGYFLLVYAFIKIKRALKGTKGVEPITKKELIPGILGALLVFGMLGGVFLIPQYSLFYKILMWVLCLGFVTTILLLDKK